MNDGMRLEPPLDLDALRQRFNGGFAKLPEKYKALKALKSPPRFPVTTSRELESLTRKVVAEVTARETAM